MKKGVLAFALAILFASAYTIAMRTYNVHETVGLTVTTAGDTALVLKVTPSTALDSFQYIDTIQPKSGGTKYVVAWTSPLWAIRLRVDSATTAATSCSLYVNGTKRLVGFTQTASPTIAKACDSFVALINAVTGVKDSLVAQDSNTYVKIVSKFAQNHTQIPATRFYGVRGGAVGSKDMKLHFDTAWATTIALTCDSLKRIADTLTGFEDSVGLSDSTTFYTVYAKQKGLPFVFKAADSAEDGATDTSTLVSNKTSYSSKTDTVWLGEIADRNWNATAMLFKATFKAGKSTADTLGHCQFLDSASIQIYTVSELDGSWFFLDSFVGDTVGNRTMTKRIVKTGMTSGAGIDTLFKGPLVAIIRVVDSTSDTTKTTANEYKFDANWWLK